MTGHNDMEHFKSEVQSQMNRMAESVDKMADSITMLVENDIRRQEREDRQQEVNSRMSDRINRLETFREDILVKRAEESPSRNWLLKNYPWLAIIVVLASGYIVKFPIQ